ncbi:MAG: M24 family metallopeptidase [Thermotogota bacterium]
MKIGIMQNFMKENNLEAVLIFNTEDSTPSIFYLTGFSGNDGALLLTQKEAKIIVDSRYTEEVKEVLTNEISLVKTGKKNIYEAIEDEIKNIDIRKIGIEYSKIYHRDFEKIFKNKNWDIVNIDDQLEAMRNIKTTQEIDVMKKAIKISEDSFVEMLNYVKPGITEKYLAAVLEFEMKKRGAEKPGFDTIVGSGYRGALPHGIASEKKIEEGDMIVIDFGARYKGYNADMTRTIGIKSISDEARKVYNVVLKANKEAIKAVKAGESGFDIDKIAREIIKEAGYGEYFGHGLGHGLGIEVHENISVSPRSKHTLKAGNVVTVEPGIYLDGKFGVRIEDDILVLDSGYENLNILKKDLIII